DGFNPCRVFVARRWRRTGALGSRAHGRRSRIIEGDPRDKELRRFAPPMAETSRSLPAGLRWDLLIEKGHRLNAGNFKTLAAADVLAGDEVVAPHHVGASFGELGAI